MNEAIEQRLREIEETANAAMPLLLVLRARLELMTYRDAMPAFRAIDELELLFTDEIGECRGKCVFCKQFVFSERDDGQCDDDPMHYSCAVKAGAFDDAEGAP